MAYDKSKDLAKRTQSDKVLRDKAFKITSDPKYDGYQRGLSLMVYKFFIKNLVELVSLKNPNYQWQMSFINQYSKIKKKEKFIHLSEKIFEVLI